jgi:hypothetical protein
LSTPTASPAARRPLLRPGVELFLISFAVLFQELALIRWFPAQVRVIAYFPNLILLSAFLGLGLGCLRAGKSALTWLWPASLLALAGIAKLMSHVAFTENSITEHLWLLYYDLGPDATVINGVRLPILVCFLLSTVSFIPLGQMLAVRLQQFRAKGQPLPGYACDILGSLAGVIAFGICGFTGTGPLVWFGTFLAVGALLLVRSVRSLLAYGAAAAALLALVHTRHPVLYSPYYALTVGQIHDGSGIAIQANGSMHQYAFRLNDPQAPDPHHVREGYHLPYRLLPAPARRVLVLGAGSGNDVAVALAEGAESVTAVEIDPVILELGALHPDRPYADPRVRRVNTDARAFLNESREQFDLIVFGTLDSMTRLSALSNVRLDNFVYTQECVNAAAAHLAPGGGLVMYFMSAEGYIDNRLTGMVAAPFRQLPVVIEGRYFVFNRIYLGGPAFEAQDGVRRRALFPEVQPQLERGELPSDDWPYLYLQTRGLSSFYITLILAIAAISVAAVALASRAMRASLRRGGMDKEMFLFGLAFLLLETKSVTTMSLLWGATWLTSAVVFGAILAMVLIATLVIQFRPLPWSFVMGGLVATLVAAYFVPVHVLLSTGLLARFGLSFAFVGVPIFFAAAGFALLFRDRPEADTAFGWNLLGAVAGGLLEFASMLTGIKALYLLVLVAYLLVVLVRRQTAPAVA